jgi:hypothetical protein
MHQDQTKPPFAVSQTSGALKKLKLPGSGVQVVREPTAKDRPFFWQRVIHAQKFNGSVKLGKLLG